METTRKSGLLFHPSSLPGKFGIGTLGKEAYKFVDFLIESGQKLWQILPLGPTGFGDSPYQCFSAYAGNPLLIDFEVLYQEGWLTQKDLLLKTTFDDSSVDYGKIFTFKYPLLKKAFVNFRKNTGIDKTKFTIFCRKNIHWLDDYSLFMALKEHFKNEPWTNWENKIKMRHDDTVNYYIEHLSEEIEFQKFIQYIFFKQWTELKSYANRNYIQIIGDVPIYISLDSADAWINSDIFLFDEHCNPIEVAGVPPDYFSETGQLWGNPIFNWDRLKETGFEWWLNRIKANLILYDIVRIDHFRGFEAYWSVNYGETTAVNGQWKLAPGKELFETIREKLGEIPIIAEDLGIITEKVEELRDNFQLPGMKVLQFAFDRDPKNDYLPHNYPKNCIVYTGTHDNDTIKSWYEQSDKIDKDFINNYLNFDERNISWSLIRLAWASTADIAITPLQDILNLGGESRMNTPGEAVGNWTWRLKKDQLTTEIAHNLKAMTEIYGR
jgi:4-alpha-glucanotransferase